MSERDPFVAVLFSTLNFLKGISIVDRVFFNDKTEEDVNVDRIIKLGISYMRLVNEDKFIKKKINSSFIIDNSKHLILNSNQYSSDSKGFLSVFMILEYPILKDKLSSFQDYLAKKCEMLCSEFCSKYRTDSCSNLLGKYALEIHNNFIFIFYSSLYSKVAVPIFSHCYVFYSEALTAHLSNGMKTIIVCNDVESTKIDATKMFYFLSYFLFDSLISLSSPKFKDYIIPDLRVQIYICDDFNSKLIPEMFRSFVFIDMINNVSINYNTKHIRNAPICLNVVDVLINSSADFIDVMYDMQYKLIINKVIQYLTLNGIKKLCDLNIISKKDEYVISGLSDELYRI